MPYERGVSHKFSLVNGGVQEKVCESMTYCTPLLDPSHCVGIASAEISTTMKLENMKFRLHQGAHSNFSVSMLQFH